MKHLFLISILFIISCGSTEDLAVDGGSTTTDWLIPPGEVFDGGPGKDGIPSVDNPNFDTVAEAGFINPRRLVVGVVHNGIAKAYPHNILDWHEIVNDEIGDLSYALTYCPLTGTAVSWDRMVNGTKTTFGVSGKLYNTNLMPYDRGTDSYWSQLRLDCVNGELTGTTINTLQAIETDWETWVASYPNTLIMNEDTGIDRNYENYPYGDYRTNNANIIFPVSPMDTRLPAKERVLAIIENGDNKVYSINLFSTGKVFEERLNDKDVLVFGSNANNYMVAYENNDFVGFRSLINSFPAIAEDEDGNRVSLSGEIISGPRQGEQLEPVESIIGYYFSLAAFYPGIEIYE